MSQLKFCRQIPIFLSKKKKRKKKKETNKHGEKNLIVIRIPFLFKETTKMKPNPKERFFAMKPKDFESIWYLVVS